MNMDAKPRVSIILSLYQSKQFLEYWLSSIAQQTIWSETELVICANDASKNEIEILNCFEDQYTNQVIVEYVPRETLYATWNRCVKIAKSNLIAIANVDDIRTPNGLERQVEIMESRPEFTYCYGPYYKVTNFPAQEGDLETVKEYDQEEYDQEEYTRSMLLGPFFLWRKAFHQTGGYFDEQFKSGGDFDFAIRLALHGRGIKVEDILGFYYDAGAGLSTGNKLQPIERTVIELRYGIYDKIDYSYIPDAVKYNVPNVYWDGAWHPVENYVPGYKNMMSERQAHWFEKGIKNYYNALQKKRGISFNRRVARWGKSFLQKLIAKNLVGRPLEIVRNWRVKK